MSYISISMTISLFPIALSHPSLQTSPAAKRKNGKIAKGEGTYHIEMCLAFGSVIYESYIFHNLSRQMRR